MTAARIRLAKVLITLFKNSFIAIPSLVDDTSITHTDTKRAVKSLFGNIAQWIKTCDIETVLCFLRFAGTSATAAAEKSGYFNELIMKLLKMNKC